MNGCDSETLSRYIDGELPPQQARNVRAHIEACATCSEAYEALQQLDTLCRDVLPKTAFHAPALPRRRHYRFAAAAAAVALLVAGGFTYAAIRETLFTPEPASNPAVEETAAVSPAGGTAAPDTDTVAPPTAPAGAQPVAPAPAAGESGGRVFRGTLVNADGEPVAGASVSATGRNAPSTTTSASGAFELPWHGDATGFQIKGPGYDGLFANLEDAPRDADVTARILLLRMQEATGKVVDSAGRPFAGVHVRCRDSSAATTTATNGSFTLRTQGRIVLSYPGFPETVCSVDDFTSTYALSAGGAVRARVVKGSVPAPGVRVRLASENSESREATTNAEGVATFERVPLGPFTIHADDGVDFSVESGQPVQEGKTSECTLTIHETRAGTVRGKVIDADGAPVADANVQIYSVDDPTVRRTVTTGADGGFESALWPGRNDVQLEWWSLRTRYPDCRAANGGLISVLPDLSRAAYTELRLERLQMERVTLQNERGEPLRNAVVEWEPGFTCAPTGALSLATANGEVQVPAGVKWVRAYDPETGRLGGVTFESGQPARLRCDKPATHIRGRIVDPQGDPVPYAMIHAGMRDENKPWAPERCITQSARDGRFTLGPLAADASYRIYMYCRGYDFPRELSENPIAVSAGMPEMNIVARPLDAVVEGRVLNSDGSPVANAWLGLESGDYNFGILLPTGLFSLNLLPGDYTLKASATRGAGEGAWSEPAVVTAPAKNVVLRIPQTGVGEKPGGAEYEAAENSLKQMGVVFKMFAGEWKGVYPELSRTPGVFAPDLSVIYPEYLSDANIVQWIAGRQNAKVVYLGYATTNTEAGMAFLDAYQQYGPEGIAGEDIPLPEGATAGGLDHVFRLREGIERFFITDINDPGSGARAQSTIPLMWEMPGAHAESGGFVLFMDGHTEWREYPGDYPMVPEFIDRINGLSPKK